MQTRAFSLLRPGRAILVEVDEVRHPARVLRAPNNAAISVELVGDAGGFPPAGNPVTLIVPVLHSSWRFPTSVLEPPAAGSPFATFHLPQTGEQLAGRYAARVDVSIPLRCRSSDSDAAEWIATYALDLSSTGLRLAFPHVLEKQARLDVELTFPDRVLTVQSAVAWQRPLVEQPGDSMYGVGVRIQAISDSARQALSRMLLRAPSRTRMDEIRGGLSVS